VTDEYFSPVADGYGWMENASSWPTNGVYLRYTLVPRQPPSARITSSSDRVLRGQRIQVAATASDNVRIARVAFSVDGRALASDASAPYSALLPSANLAAARRRARRAAGARGRALALVPDRVHEAQGRALLDPLPLHAHRSGDVPLPRARAQADRLRVQHRQLTEPPRQRPLNSGSRFSWNAFAPSA
jgi:hypothetical protein